jgi:hypothetical protein
VPPDIELFGRHRAGSFAMRDDPKRGVAPVPYSSVANFGAIVESWFGQYDALEPIVNLYLFGKHNKHLDIGNTFLGIMQALEAFHRTFHSGFFMAKSEYDEKIRPVLNSAIPEFVKGDFRQRIKSAIEFGFEFSLRRRLRELAESLPTTDFFERVRNPEFRNRSVDTRNAMTHQIPDPAFQPMDGPELYTAIQIWREVLFALVLAKIGVTEESIISAVGRLQGRRGTAVMF